jgi:guanine deaminase
VHEIIRGPILNPTSESMVDFLPDGALAADANGIITFIGPWQELTPKLPKNFPIRRSHGIIVPPFLDAHTHIPQNPIRGRFTEGVDANDPQGRLLAGLNRNVFPEESRNSDPDYSAQITEQFFQDTLSQGVIGGAAYMTVHPDATREALTMLPKTWSVGMVLMNQNCPEFLRTNEQTLDQDLCDLAEEFAPRFILTDRFAVSVNTPLRKRAVAIAKQTGLRSQTHLNEQRSEKQFVEQKLYTNYSSYTDVYRRDGLLDLNCILAHCIHMNGDEWSVARDTASSIAHCPTSNSLLGSGIMNFDTACARGIPYALCTDVGASPTTSLLCEMEHFLIVHSNRHTQATPQSALAAVTFCPAKILGLDTIGSFAIGKDFSFVEIDHFARKIDHLTSDQAILTALLDSSQEEIEARAALCKPQLDRLESQGLSAESDIRYLRDLVDHSIRRLESKILRVTLKGNPVWRRQSASSPAAEDA